MMLSCLSALIYGMTFTFKETLIRDNYSGPAFFPRIIAICLALLSIALIITSLVKPKDIQREKEESKAIFNKTMFKPIVAGLFLVVYVLFLFEPLGFTVSSIIVFIGLLVISQTKVKAYYIIAPIFVIGVSLLFRYGFMVQLPTGIVGF